MSAKTVRNWFLSVVAFAVGILYPAVGISKGTDVTFRGPATRIQQSDPQHGRFSVQLEQAEITVVVDAETDIEVEGDPSGLSGLAVGDFVKVSGYYSPQGVVAREVQILDDKGSDFRIHGPITAMVNSAAGASLMVLGQSVVLDKDSRISRRGAGQALLPSDLAPGMDVDVRGLSADGQLVVRALIVGSRQDDSTRVRFEGTVRDVQGSRMSVDTEGGGLAVVLLPSSATVKGSIAPGQRVEIKGNLNDRLEVEAQVVKADDFNDDNGNDTGGHDNIGDDKGNTSPAIQSRKAITLTAMTPGAGTGAAESEFETEEGKTTESFSVEIEDVLPQRDFHILLTLASGGTVDLGVLSSDPRGKARTGLSAAALGSLLPAGKDVRDIAMVQITLNGTVILAGSF